MAPPRQSKRASATNVSNGYDPHGRDDDYAANDSYYEDANTQNYEGNMGGGGSHIGGNAQYAQNAQNAHHSQQTQHAQHAHQGHGMGQMPAQHDRGRTATKGTGRASSRSRTRSRSRGTAYAGGGAGAAGMSNAGARASHAQLSSTKHQIEHSRCLDKRCGMPIAWRNAEDVSVAMHMQSSIDQGVNNYANVNHNVNTSPNKNCSLGPRHANQDAREVQMMLMDILSQTGLPLADLATATQLEGGIVPGFNLLSVDTVGHHGMAQGMMGGGLPHQSTRAWEVSHMAVENDRREFFYYNRALTANVILSPHCELHTCRYFFSREGCIFKKLPLDTVCNFHAVCPVPNCKTAKTQFAGPLSTDRSIQWVRAEFCPAHMCMAEGCMLRQDLSEDGKELKYCPRHKCHRCSKIAMPGFELCKKHVECAQHNCTLPCKVLSADRVPNQKDLVNCGVEYYDRKPYLLYCGNHAHCADPQCDLLRKKPAVYCFKHVCNETGCGLGTTEERKYCDRHRCQQSGCFQPKHWQSDLKNRENFCLGHLCRVSNCGRGSGEDRLYCDQHKCEIEGCMSKDAGGLYCVNHAHFESEKVGEKKADRRTERLAGLFSPAHPNPYFQGYPGHPFSHIGSVYAGGSTTSRSSHRTRSSRGSQHRSHDESSDDNEDYSLDWNRDRDRDRDRTDRGRQHRGDDSSDPPTHGGPASRPGSRNETGFGTASANGPNHPRANQQHPTAGPMNGNGPALGVPISGPARPATGNGGRPMGNGGAGIPGGPGGPSQGGARGGPP